MNAWESGSASWLSRFATSCRATRRESCSSATCAPPIWQRLRRVAMSSTTRHESPVETAMNMPGNYEIRKGIAILTMCNPPVNGLGLSTRRALVESLTRAIDDTQVKAIEQTAWNERRHDDRGTD